MQWSDQHPLLARVLGVTAGAMIGGLLAGALVLLSPSAPPEGEAVFVPAVPPPVDPRMALIEEHCQQGATTLGELGRAITRAGNLLDEAVMAELDHAMIYMTHHAAVPDPRLTQIFGDIEISLRELRQAIEAGAGVRAALSDTLNLVNDLEDRCHDLILGGVESGPA